MTSEGVLCKDCLAFDPPKQNSWEAKEGTKLTLEGSKVPQLIKITTVGSSPSTGTAQTIGPTYEINAYASLTGITPSAITISPLFTMSSAYDPNELPKNISQVTLSYYPNPSQGWLAMGSEGVVAEVGQARGTLNYFVPDTLLTKLAKTAAKFEVSNLTINPTQTQPTQQVTISVNVANTGGTSGDYTVELKVNGVVESTKQITLGAGASQIVSFTIAEDAIGKYQIEIAGLTGEFVVTGPTGLNWWLIGGIIAAVILALAIWMLVRWRRFS
jgi:LPXTG-motif cell wall-anchored protein